MIKNQTFKTERSIIYFSFLHMQLICKIVKQHMQIHFCKCLKCNAVFAFEEDMQDHLCNTGHTDYETIL